MLNSRDPELLHPELRTKWEDIAADMETLGWPIKLSSTYRDTEYQRELFSRGRDEHGRSINHKKIVTWTLNSKHNALDEEDKPAARAFDFFFAKDQDLDGKLSQEEIYGKGLPWGLVLMLGVEKYGLRTLGRFVRERQMWVGDLTHLEMRD